MKIIYVIALLIIIIGGLVWAGVFKKDLTSNDTLNQMTESNSVATSTNPTPTPTPTPSPAQNQNPAVTPVVATSFERTDWDGTYKIVEFGNIVPDSNPMSYDAYGYTDIEIVFMHDRGSEVTISRNLDDNRPIVMSGKGRINTKGIFEVVSDSGDVLVTLEYGDFGANNDTRITLGTMVPLLQTTTTKYFDTLKKDL